MWVGVWVCVGVSVGRDEYVFAGVWVCVSVIVGRGDQRCVWCV